MPPFKRQLYKTHHISTKAQFLNTAYLVQEIVCLKKIPFHFLGVLDAWKQRIPSQVVALLRIHVPLLDQAVKKKMELGLWKATEHLLAD